MTASEVTAATRLILSDLHIWITKHYLLNFVPVFNKYLLFLSAISRLSL